MTYRNTDPERSNPKLAAAYSVVGNQSRNMLRNMIVALQLHPHLNTAEDTARLEAARYIIKHSSYRKGIARPYGRR